MRINRLGGDDHFDRILRENRVVQRAAPLGRTSVTNGHTEFNGNESILVNGSGKVTGWWIVTGWLKVVGTLLMEGFMSITGNVTATGIFNQNGPWNLAGTGGITGDVSSTGNWTQTGFYTISAGGKITVLGPLPMVIGTTSGGRPGIAFPGGVLSSSADRIVMEGGGSVGVIAASNFAGLYYDSGHNLATGSTGTVINGGLKVFGEKLFVMEHPLKDGFELRHGATESPVSGTEYWGEGRLDQNGAARVNLPDYFDALNKPAGRTVLVTGRGYALDWSDIDANHFTVTGVPGGRFSWLVKAERFGGDFVVEEIADQNWMGFGDSKNSVQ